MLTSRPYEISLILPGRGQMSAEEVVSTLWQLLQAQQTRNHSQRTRAHTRAAWARVPPPRPGPDACRGQMSAEEVVSILWQLLQALRYLHALDVWHRDLKSSNLLLGRVGGRRIVKARHLAASCTQRAQPAHLQRKPNDLLLSRARGGAGPLSRRATWLQSKI